MATTFFEPSVEHKTAINPLGLKGVDHIEFIVDNADQWRDFFVGKYGMTSRFYADNASGVRGRRAHVVGQGRINFVVAEPQGSGEEADFMRWHLEKHGCGVRDVAFRVKDAKRTPTPRLRAAAPSPRAGSSRAPASRTAPSRPMATRSTASSSAARTVSSPRATSTSRAASRTATSTSR